MQELHPSFPPSLHPGSGSSSRSFKAINKGHVTLAQVNPRCQMNRALLSRIKKTAAHGMRIPVSGITVFCRGYDGPGRKALNERLVFHDLYGREWEGEGGSSCRLKARIV